MDISKLIKQGESETLEFKQSFNKGEVSETLSAMANRNGGNILVGVSNMGEIKGIHLGKEKNFVTSYQNEAWLCLI